MAYEVAFATERDSYIKPIVACQPGGLGQQQVLLRVVHLLVDPQIAQKSMELW